MQCRSHSRRRTIECLFVTACSMDEYAEEKTTEKNLIVRSGISEAETNNKRLRSTFCIEAKQTRSIARLLCDSRVSCISHLDTKTVKLCNKRLLLQLLRISYLKANKVSKSEGTRKVETHRPIIETVLMLFTQKSSKLVHACRSYIVQLAKVETVYYKYVCL